MYAKCKAWIHAHSVVLLLALLLLAAAACLLSGGEDVPGDEIRTQPIRKELESAADDSEGIRERIGAAEKTANRIEKSADRSGKIADEAAGIAEKCQRIIAEIRRRAEESTAADEP